MNMAELRYQCAKRPDLKFSNQKTCELRIFRAAKQPDNISLARCRGCAGPIEIPPQEVTVESKPKTTTADAVKIPLCSVCGQAPSMLAKYGRRRRRWLGRCVECNKKHMAMMTEKRLAKMAERKAAGLPAQKPRQKSKTAPPHMPPELAEELWAAHREMGRAMAAYDLKMLLVAGSQVFSLLNLAARLGHLPGPLEDAA